MLSDRRCLKVLYTMLLTMPGIPSVYYGSEWGLEGDKRWGDAALRPALERPEWNALTDRIAAMARIHRGSEALCWGDFRELVLTNRQTVLRRQSEHQRVLFAVNADSAPYTAWFDAGCGALRDMETGVELAFTGSLELAPYSCRFLECR